MMRERERAERRTGRELGLDERVLWMAERVRLGEVVVEVLLGAEHEDASGRRHQARGGDRAHELQTAENARGRQARATRQRVGRVRQWNDEYDRVQRRQQELEVGGLVDLGEAAFMSE